MPVRIEHIWRNGQELKWCAKCEGFLLLSKFHTTGNRTWDNLFYICIECEKEKRKNSPRRHASATWRHMQRRIQEDQRYIKKGIKIKIVKDEFVKWYIKNWFPRCRIDRIDNDGHYELSNIQLLTQQEHNAKIRSDRLDRLGIKEPEGKRYCYGCEKMKIYDDFYRKKRKIFKSNPLGLDEHCKKCVREKRKEYYQREGK